MKFAADAALHKVCRGDGLMLLVILFLAIPA